MSRLRKSLTFLSVGLGLFVLARILLFLSYPERFGHLPIGEVGAAFIEGLRFDVSVLARVCGIPVLMMALPGRLFDRRIWFEGWAWMCYLLILALTLVLAGDVIYFGHVSRHLSYELTSLGGDSGYLFSEAWRNHLVALLVFLLVSVGLFRIWRYVLSRASVSSRHAMLSVPALFLALVVAGRGGLSGKPLEIIDAYDTGESSYGQLVLNGAFTGMVFALNLNHPRHKFFDEGRAISYFSQLRPVQHRAFPMLQHRIAEPTRHNLIFFLLESWDFNFVDSFGHRGVGATPNFDHLAANGRRFVRFYAAGQRSIDAIQSTLTGIPPLAGVPRLDAGIGISNFTRLGEVARSHGYRTIFVQSSRRDSFKVQGIARADGFSEYYGMEDIPLRLHYPEPEAAWYGWDYDTLMFLKQKLDQGKQPFLAYLFTGTTHPPYAPLPERFRWKPYDSSGINGYLNILRYSDWSIGRFMAAAKKAPWFKNTIFIFCADHANGFEQRTTESRFHIPFLIYAPGIIQPGADQKIGSQLDVLPTIWDLLGFDEPFAAVGQSLFDDTAQRFAFFNEGDQRIGLVTRDALLTHNLQKRLEAKGQAAELDLLENELLALDQVSYDALRNNRWMPH